LQIYWSIWRVKSGVSRASLELSPPAEAWPTIVHNCTFAEMKKHGDELMPQAKMILRGGSDSFFYKGTNGRWRDVLGAEELRLYDAAPTVN